MSAKRHRWVKVRIHVYICRDCGMGRVNSEREPGWWVTTFHRPDGTSRRATHVPACEPGPLTADYLEKYGDIIATWKGHRHAIEMRPSSQRADEAQL